MDMMVGDIGGTNARLAWASWRDGALQLDGIRIFRSADFTDFGDILRSFVDGRSVEHACIGVPGPVHDNHCRVTNLPWELDGDRLARSLGLGRVTLINDLQAAASGLDAVPPAHLRLLSPGEAVSGGNQAVIAPGTGLGEAGRVFDGRRYRAHATEGGHASFAPFDRQTFALQQWLADRHGHVSWERLLSGPGLSAIDQFLATADDPAAKPRDAALIDAADKAGETRAHRALQLFVSLLGREAGNLALKWMATGGLYLAGGIAPHIGDRLLDYGLREAYLDKGRMRPLLEQIPFQLVSDPYLALRGAAMYSASLD